LVKFNSAHADGEPARALLAAMREEMAALYQDLDIDAREMPTAAANSALPLGDFILGLGADGDAVCCAGIKRLPGGACGPGECLGLPCLPGTGRVRAP